MAKKTRYSAPVSVRIPTPIVKDLDRLARKYGVPRSRLVVEALEALIADPPVVRPRRPLGESAGESGADGVFE